MASVSVLQCYFGPASISGLQLRGHIRSFTHTASDLTFVAAVDFDNAMARQTSASCATNDGLAASRGDDEINSGEEWKSLNVANYGLVQKVS